ncbi:MAG: hypothetical protein RIQ92_1346 [Actinomycetota bacterium]|jgi:hypothetical protein
MEISFTSEVIEWRGPAPFLFAPIPPKRSVEIKEISNQVSYGWGVIPVEATIGMTTLTTSLFPKDGIYLLPIKVAMQRAEGIEVGSKIRAKISIDLQAKSR